MKKYSYDWTLGNADFTKDKGSAFSCFSCGGGSTMGYKLAGFDVIGCNEIDPKMMEAYKINHNPKFSYLEPIQEFKNRKDLPNELYSLDILDGSPPCSSFSMAGNREKNWGKEKKFREGQVEQVLDTLFFDFIDLGERLQPKVIIAENVKGLLMGDAQKYVNDILTRFDEIGYYVDYKLLNAAKMGVPQRRERVFFYAIRKDLYRGGFEDLFGTQPILDLKFNEVGIKFKELKDLNGRILGDDGKIGKLWSLRQPQDKSMSDTCLREWGRNSYFNQSYLHDNIISPTTTAKEDCLIIYESPRYTSQAEICKIGSYPLDYNFLGVKPHYLIGMSVPPLMTAGVADRIYDQWLSKIE